MPKSNFIQFMQARQLRQILTEVVTSLLLFRIIQTSVINTVHNQENVHLPSFNEQTIWVWFRTKIFSSGNYNQSSTFNRRNNSATTTFFCTTPIISQNIVRLSSQYMCENVVVREFCLPSTILDLKIDTDTQTCNVFALLQGICTGS